MEKKFNVARLPTRSPYGNRPRENSIWQFPKMREKSMPTESMLDERFIPRSHLTRQEPDSAPGTVTQTRLLQHELELNAEHAYFRQESDYDGPDIVKAKLHPIERKMRITLDRGGIRSTYDLNFNQKTLKFLPMELTWQDRTAVRVQKIGVAGKPENAIPREEVLKAAFEVLWHAHRELPQEDPNPSHVISNWIVALHHAVSKKPAK